MTKNLLYTNSLAQIDSSDSTWGKARAQHSRQVRGENFCRLGESGCVRVQLHGLGFVSGGCSSRRFFRPNTCSLSCSARIVRLCAGRRVDFWVKMCKFLQMLYKQPCTPAQLFVQKKGSRHLQLCTQICRCSYWRCSPQSSQRTFSLLKHPNTLVKTVRLTLANWSFNYRRSKSKEEHGASRLHDIHIRQHPGRLW